MGLVARSRARFRAVVQRALEEQTTPAKIGAALALGALIGSSPLVGLHSVLAVVLASVLRLNRAITFLGTNVSFGPLIGLFVSGEVWLGSRVLGRPPPHFSSEPVVGVATRALGAWWMGYVIIAPVLAAAAWALGYGLGRARQRRAAVAAAARAFEISAGLAGGLLVTPAHQPRGPGLGVGGAPGLPFGAKERAGLGDQPGGRIGGLEAVERDLARRPGHAGGACPERAGRVEQKAVADEIWLVRLALEEHPAAVRGVHGAARQPGEPAGPAANSCIRLVMRRAKRFGSSSLPPSINTA